MGLRCGIIGLPNVGKSTLFNILTKSNIPAQNFPFCTIQPNIGIAPVFDNRLNIIAGIINPKKIITSYIEFVDIAGLVKGASTGSGLGNQFLSNIRTSDAIIHVVRCFDDNNIIHIHNKIQPEYDIEIVNIELILSDLQICQKELLRFNNNKSNILKNNKKINILNRCFHHLQNFKMIRTLSLNTEELELIKYINFITLKPILYVANIINNNTKMIYFEQLLNANILENNICIPIDILLESNNITVTSNNIKNVNYLEVQNSQISKLVQSAYNLLELHNFFTVGKKEVRSWTINKGITIFEASKTIHSDFKRGFIRAQVISYVDFVRFKSVNKIKELGKLRIEGKKYVVQNGDIIQFLFKV